MFQHLGVVTPDTVVRCGPQARPTLASGLGVVTL